MIQWVACGRCRTRAFLHRAALSSARRRNGEIVPVAPEDEGRRDEAGERRNPRLGDEQRAIPVQHAGQRAGLTPGLAIAVERSPAGRRRGGSWSGTRAPGPNNCRSSASSRKATGGAESAHNGSCAAGRDLCASRRARSPDGAPAASRRSSSRLGARLAIVHATAAPQSCPTT